MMDQITSYCLDDVLVPNWCQVITKFSDEENCLCLSVSQGLNFIWLNQLVLWNNDKLEITFQIVNSQKTMSLARMIYGV